MTHDDRRRATARPMRYTHPEPSAPRRRTPSPAPFAVGLAALTVAAFAGGVALRTREAHPGASRLRLLPAGAAAPAEVQVAGPGAALAAERPAGGNRGARTAAVALQEREQARAGAAAETFENVYNLVKEHYVDPLPGDDKLSRGVARGMVAALNDPNSFFLEPAQRAVLDAEAAGDYAGIGAGLALRTAKKDGFSETKVVVVAPLPGSPAAEAGLRPGDVVTHVNGRWVLGSNPMLEVDRLYKKVQNRDATEEELDKATEAATARIRGGISLVSAFLKLRTGSGDKLTLTVQRAGSPRPLTLTLTTAVTPAEAASSRAVTAPGGGEAGYLRLGAFSDRTAKAFRDALAALPEGAPLVLDLRGNPGGTLDAAQAVDAALTQGGTFTVQVGPGGKKTNIASPVSTSRRPRPVAVLVDAGTASTAEALAASLADKGVGVVVGPSRTFGDGLMQTLYPLPDGSGFLLTTGRFVGPRGTDWNGAGLAPSVALPAGATDDQAIAAALSALRSRSSVALR